jgi:hypothetical protein
VKKNYLCQICNKKTYFVFSLGNQPLCDDLKKIGKKSKNKLFPINIFFCKKCKTAYNEVQIKPKILFPKSYHYRSGLTLDVKNGMKDLVENLENKYGNLKKKKILDIGSNDGTLLDIFKKKNALTIGVEPTEAYKNCKHKIYNSFFNKQIANKIKQEYKNIDFIIFTNVFAHINDLKKLLTNLKILISQNTKIVIENHYLGSVIKKKQFDTFYHEHPRTYSLSSFLKISKLIDLKIEHTSFPKRYGGNIRVFMGNQSSKKIDKLNRKILISENSFYIDLLNFNKFIQSWKKRTLTKIQFLKKKKIDIVGKAFPGRASILITLLNLNKKIINAIYEKPNSPKIGFYVPNSNIPIISDEKLKDINKKTIIINFAWHIKKEIFNYLKKKNIKNKLINIL